MVMTLKWSATIAAEGNRMAVEFARNVHLGGEVAARAAEGLSLSLPRAPAVEG